ncbi:iron-containing redox enzyme family protein [Salininema proteolyticum]|uniref:Iron-containing redox enzyme family protein n=1 Tax=Salininema proteolyticum TaxID=1607685 RepID=A0ABV8TV32_9ACTN
MTYDETLDDEAAQQAKSILGNRLAAPARDTVERLYGHYFPPVPAFDGWDDDTEAFIRAEDNDREATLTALRPRDDAHGRFLHQTLAEIYPNTFTYRDSPAHETADDGLEVSMFSARVRLEREYLRHWLPFPHVPRYETQEEAADHLEHLAATNPGVDHPLFDYLAAEAPRRHLEKFLRGETIRNEIVDDEVALLTVGLQGTQKAVVAANLWDECGRGRLENFHTFWLRRLIDRSENGWEGFYDYRENHPWFAKITSNTNAMLLSRPAYTQQAYGCFLVFESWVAPHFTHILTAMDRFAIDEADRRIYFAAHVAVDPRHADELADGVRFQRPRLSPAEIHRVLQGAHLAADAGKRQYDLWLDHFRTDKEHTA